jgi:hypothetical protein
MEGTLGLEPRLENSKFSVLTITLYPYMVRVTGFEPALSPRSKLGG